MITNPQSGTNVFEIAPGIYRINTPVSIPGGPEFNFNQYLIVDDEPLVFHTGPRKTFPLVLEAIERVMPIDRLRYVTLSHFEADECGALNEFLAAAPRANGRVRNVGAGQTRPALVGHVARSSWMGMRPDVRDAHQDFAMRGSFH